MTRDSGELTALRRPHGTNNMMDRGLLLAFALLVLLALTRAQDAGILKVGFIQIAAGSATSSIFLYHQLLLLLLLISNYATAVFMHVCAKPALH